MLRERPATHARLRNAPCRRRTAAWLSTLTALAIAVTGAALWLGAVVFGPLAAPLAESGTGGTASSGTASTSRLALSQPKTPESPVRTAGNLVPSRRARRSCPRAASACVDLSARLTWLQSDGRISYGPVRMEPGPPGTSHATPRGTFHVAWKVGAHYLSAEYGEAMPYAVFFAEGGIAFHGGSLTRRSHGCIHLSIRSARYYHDHLPIGAEVIVFSSR